jgi:hypothetical protein
MMKVTFKRPRGLNEEGRRQEKLLKTYVTTLLMKGLTQFQHDIMETPVYTGKMLVNFRWSLGSPVEGVRAAITQPTLPGKTSDLPLGSEPRRIANTRVVEEEFQSMIASIRVNPFQDIYLRNNVEYFSEVEYGSYAHVDGKTSRTPPGGMTRRGETALEHYMEGLLKRVA